MVSIPDGTWVDNATDAIELRKSLGSLLVPGGPAVTRPGRLPGPGSPLTVSPTTPPSLGVKVNAGKAVTLRSAAYGPVIGVGPDGDLTVPLDPAPTSGSRWDLIYLLQRDTGAPANDSTGGAVVDVVKGTAASQPQRPELPPGALLLGEVNPTAGDTSYGSARVADKPVWTNTRGAPIHVADLFERNNIPAFEGLQVFRRDTGQYETYWNGVWRNNNAVLPWVGRWPTGGGFQAGAQADWTDLFDGTFSVAVGSTLEVEVSIPRLRVEANSSVLLRLLVSDSVLDYKAASVGGAAVEFPGPHLRGDWAGGTSARIRLQMRGTGGGGWVFGTENGGPILRTRNL